MVAQINKPTQSSKPQINGAQQLQKTRLNYTHTHHPTNTPNTLQTIHTTHAHTQVHHKLPSTATYKTICMHRHITLLTAL
jgi:hypothetical protein